MTDPHGLKARRGALALIAAVLDEGRSLDAGKEAALGGLAPADRARAGDLAAAALRWLKPIDALLDELMRQPIAPSAHIARDALRLAVAEIGALDTPPHAAVDAAVRLTRADRKAAPLAGLVNAVARRAAGTAAARFAAEAGSAAPDWLAKALRADWGAEFAAAIMTAHQQPAPLDLTLRDAAEAGRWSAALDADILPTGGLRLRRGVQITAAPGFAEGAWWAQDAAASIPARLLGAGPGARVLDLCAAPGGKTLQLAAAGARVTALDHSETRLARLRENLARTGLSAEIVAADALTWRPAEPFPFILLDAPCSATGTIRRHPDLPHRRGARDVAALAELQARMLDAAWEMLAPGGRLVFCTCSLLKAEGEAQAAVFPARRPDARRLPLTAAEAGDAVFLSPEGDLRARPDLWAAQGGIDGFFAARFDKA
ncbi:MAG: RsmB/NOP family class I SAM-dependent RNA methyltransferase [Rubrimonas sp.]|uniref:RsmB/NOP family class I SAM-dependent RNA methyltransferase n=1 Tax=Rubrimonas sp. TaxID=2036015 RepID=UPI002FDE188F